MRKRTAETDEGIQGPGDVLVYDQMQRFLRDKGWIETDSLIAGGITNGHALEIGPGPGYLGLEWLKKTRGTTLRAIDVSPGMIDLARKNARDYGLESRAEYREGRAEQIPFPDGTFDAVFSNGSLHEWSEPGHVFDEIYRVLKPGGKYHISDLKRNMNFLVAWFLKITVQPPEIRPGLKTSIGAAYTRPELQEILARTRLNSATVSENVIGLQVKGVT